MVLWHRYHIQNLLSSYMVLQRFFSSSLAPLPYTEPVKLLYGSSAVLWHRYHIQNLLSSYMVLQRFFSRSLAPLPYTEPVKLLYGSSAVLWHRYHLVFSCTHKIQCLCGNITHTHTHTHTHTKILTLTNTNAHTHTQFSMCADPRLACSDLSGSAVSP